MRRDIEKNIAKNKMFSERLMIIQIIFVIFVAFFILYLFLVQVFDVRHFRQKARNQRRASSFVMRGNIYDTNGIKLATDTVYYDIFARKADFQHEPEELAKMLAPILKISQVNLTEKLMMKLKLSLFLLIQILWINLLPTDVLLIHSVVSVIL